MPSSSSSTFVFCTCQPGAEAALKSEVAVRRPHWRLAFSRPGFVSFKCEESVGAALDGAMPVFARTRSVSLGRLKEPRLGEASDAVWALEAVRALLAAHEVVGLHVWQRDTLLPGEGDFEPTVTPLALDVKQSLVDAAQSAGLARHTAAFEAKVAASGSVVLDVVLVEPDEWYIGWHRAASRVERWPGGMLPVAGPPDMVSRAYLKMEEALKWSALPAARGDVWVELGCAPGGASQALLNRGFEVLGVDPAEVDPLVAQHPQFTHFGKRSSEVRRTEFIPAKWLAADLNVAPSYTLDAVEDVVSHASTSIRGMVLTLKLADWDVAAPDKLAEYIARIRRWGFRDVRLRQLVHNRREICVVALHSRGQRRMKRARRRPTTREVPGEGDDRPADRIRFDAPTRMTPPHHFR